MKAMNWMMVATMALSGIGCASLPRMDPAGPIEIDSGPFGPRYKQDGKSGPRGLAGRLPVKGTGHREPPPRISDVESAAMGSPSQPSSASRHPEYAMTTTVMSVERPIR